MFYNPKLDTNFMYLLFIGGITLATRVASSILSAIIVSLLVVKLLISGRLTNIEPLTFELNFYFKIDICNPS